jgi:hypothetical protein
MLFDHYFDVVCDDKLLLEHIHSKHIEKKWGDKNVMCARTHLSTQMHKLMLPSFYVLKIY